MRSFAAKVALFATCAVAVVASVFGVGSPAYADASAYAKNLKLTGLADGETVQVFQLMGYGADYNTYEFDTTSTDGKTSFDTYLGNAATAAGKSKEVYLSGLSGSDLSSFLATYLYGTATYALPTPAETAVSGSEATLSLEPGYYLISIKTTGDKSRIYKPFSAFVKMNGDASTILAGGMDQASSEATVEVAMKSEDGPTIDQRVRRANGTDMDSTWKKTKTVAVGETITYRIALTIPSWDASTSPRLELVDTLANQQYVSGSVALYSGIGDEGTSYNPTGSIDGAVNETTIGTYGVSGAQDLTFTIDYSKLSGGQTYYITYTTKVMGDITGTENTGDMKATNSAYLHYSTSQASYSDTTTSTTTLFTYAARLVKQTVDTKLLQGSAFTVYEDEACTQAIAFELVNTSVDSWYYRPSSTAANTVTEIKADGEGAYLLIKGLDPYKDYYIKETTTPKGYYAPAGVFKLDLDSAKSADDSTEHSGGLSSESLVTYTNEADKNLVSGNVDNDHPNQFDIVIKNSSTPSLPTTGGAGTVIFTVVGVVLMVAAVGTFIVVRRRNNA